MRPRKIYSLYSKGILVATGTTSEIAERLGTARELVANYARDSLTYKGQYTFREVGLANEVTVADIKWAEDWDRVRNEILTAGR